MYNKYTNLLMLYVYVDVVGSACYSKLQSYVIVCMFTCLFGLNRIIDSHGLPYIKPLLSDSKHDNIKTEMCSCLEHL